VDKIAKEYPKLADVINFYGKYPARNVVD